MPPPWLHRKIIPLTDFANLGLAAPILRTLATEGYVSPTPIQARAIPSILAGRDLLGIAQTGTGKTAAFALPILHRLAAAKRPAKPHRCRVLVLSPTRELTGQIADSFRTYGAGLGLEVAAVFGGVSYGPQIQALARGLDILVATPGRLIDHLDQRKISFDETEILVLDEVDQMLDLGFVKPIRRIVAKLPIRRQNLFFSATMPKEIRNLAAELLSDPAEVSITPVATTAERVRQQVILVEAPRKRALLVELFADPSMARTLVFTRTKRGADRVAEHLERAGVASQAIHGNKSQSQRERALSAFRAGRIRALVATDIAARGIDVDGVTHVVNFELPNVPESYVHRIGRTARAGANGIAISLCDGEERGLLRDIEALTRKTLPMVDRRSPERAPGQVARGPLVRAAHKPSAGQPAGGLGRDRRRPLEGDGNGLSDVAFMSASPGPGRPRGGNGDANGARHSRKRDRRRSRGPKNGARVAALPRSH